MRNCLGPSTAFLPIAPNGNSTDGRQTFFQPARFADVCIMLAPMDPRLCARVPARSSNQSRPAGDCIMLARSALITRWNSNQVPWDPWLCIESRPPWIHRGNSNQVPWDPWLCIESRPPWIHRGNSNQVPWDPWLCIMLARRLPTFTQCLPTSAYVHPMFADVCILPARSALITRWNSNQVPWDPSRELHRVPSRGIHRGNCIESRPAAPTSPGPHGID
jgi:hypothetical protein